MNGFDNPKRDPKTAEFKNQIGQGCKIKMDEAGNVLVSYTVLLIIVKVVLNTNLHFFEVLLLVDFGKHAFKLECFIL